MCRPCACRASRRMLPAVLAVGSGTFGVPVSAPGSSPLTKPSLIELPLLEGDGLARLREAALDLRAEVLRALLVAQSLLDARSQPQRLRVAQVGVVVDTPHVEAGAFVLAAPEQHLGEVDRRGRVGGIDLVG